MNILDVLRKDKIKKAVFISPHFDDAILSCGGLISELRTQKIKVGIVTVFTLGGIKPYSKQASDFISQSGFEDSAKLFKARKAEDVMACSYLDVKYKHLNFTDAAFRKNEKGENIYDQKTQYSGRLSDADKGLTKAVAYKLSQLNADDKTVLFGPLAVGQHADHIIVREALMLLPYKKIFWEDYPYNTGQDKWFLDQLRSSGRKMPFRQKEFNKKLKVAAIKKYTSQMNVLFAGKNIGDTDEYYYTPLE